MKMIINGKKVDSVSGETFDVLAPATGKVIESVPKATAEDVKKPSTRQLPGRKSGSRFLFPNGQRYCINSWTL